VYQLQNGRIALPLLDYERCGSIIRGQYYFILLRFGRLSYPARVFDGAPESFSSMIMIVNTEQCFNGIVIIAKFFLSSSFGLRML
jgi:hypothetical protein